MSGWFEPSKEEIKFLGYSQEDYHMFSEEIIFVVVSTRKLHFQVVLTRKLHFQVDLRRNLYSKEETRSHFFVCIEEEARFSGSF